MMILSIGMLNDQLGKLNDTAFMLLLVGIFGGTAILTTRGKGGLDWRVFNRFVSPLFIIIFYLLVVFGLCAIKINIFDVTDVPNDVIQAAEGGASVDENGYFRVSIDTDNKWKLSTVTVSASILRKDGWEEQRKTISLSCYTNSRRDSCSDLSSLRRRRGDGELSWSIISARGKPNISHPTNVEVVLLCILFIYVPIGMIIVLLTSAREAVEDATVNKASWVKRTAFYTIIYFGGILLWPLFLNSWFSGSEKATSLPRENFNSALDEFIKITYGDNAERTASLSESVELAYQSLLGGLVDKAEIRLKAVELLQSSIPYSTHDLAISVALNFYKRDELAESLSDAHLGARVNVMEWLENGTVNEALAEAFEATLYKKFKR